MYLDGTLIEFVSNTTEDDVNPDGIRYADVILVDCQGATCSWTGFMAQRRGRVLHIIAMNGDLELKNQDGGSLGENRFSINQDRSVANGTGAIIYYDGTYQCWRVLN